MWIEETGAFRCAACSSGANERGESSPLSNTLSSRQALISRCTVFARFTLFVHLLHFCAGRCVFDATGPQRGRLPSGEASRRGPPRPTGGLFPRSSSHHCTTSDRSEHIPHVCSAPNNAATCEHATARASFSSSSTRRARCVSPIVRLPSLRRPPPGCEHARCSIPDPAAPFPLFQSTSSSTLLSHEHAGSLWFSCP
jgi:hypothetical protein